MSETTLKAALQRAELASTITTGPDGHPFIGIRSNEEAADIALAVITSPECRQALTNLALSIKSVELPFDYHGDDVT